MMTRSNIFIPVTLAVIVLAVLFATCGRSDQNPPDINALVVRCNTLLHRADVLEKEIALLDKRIRKQEGIKHGFGY